MPLRIDRDSFGIPWVRAVSSLGVFYGQGYAHATDRLWQMELDRIRASGEVASIVGPAYRRYDAFIRRLGLVAAGARDVEALAPETREMLDAYCAGVNAAVAAMRELPIELRLLEWDVRPWTPADVAATMKIRHVLMNNAGPKLWRTRLVHALGSDAARRLVAADGRADTTIVPPAGEGTLQLSEQDLSAVFAASEAIEGQGSNSWVLHGSRTASGMPILAGDPHRMLEAPSVYAQIRLTGPEFDAAGLSIPGLPGLFHFGQTDHVAWSITHAMADSQDLFLERFDAEGNHLYGDRWMPTRREEVTIPVHGGAPDRIEIARTGHGPIVFGDPRSGTAVAMRWTALDRPARSFDAILPMLRAKDVDEVEDAMRPWVDPCNSLLSADKHGHISYLHRGRIPVRHRANGFGVVPGWTGEHEWSADLPFEAWPRLRDPEEGWIVTANNRVADGSFPHYLGMDYAAPNRARRIIERIAGLDRATVDDVEAIHADAISAAGRVFREAAKRIAPTPSRREALARLASWDADAGAESIGTTIFVSLREELAELLLETGPLAALREPGNRLFPEEPLATSLNARVRSALPRLLEREDATPLGKGSWDDALSEALDRAIARLSVALGDDVDGWRWGRVHRTEARHMLSRRFPDANLDPPVTSLGGDADTVLAATADTGLGVLHASVARYAWDLADRKNSRWVVPFGASGDPTSLHAADQQEPWSRVKLLPVENEIVAGQDLDVR